MIYWIQFILKLNPFVDLLHRICAGNESNHIHILVLLDLHII